MTEVQFDTIHTELNDKWLSLLAVKNKTDADWLEIKKVQSSIQKLHDNFYTIDPITKR